MFGREKKRSRWAEYWQSFIDGSWGGLAALFGLALWVRWENRRRRRRVKLAE